jgi:predicted amidohydrolase
MSIERVRIASLQYYIRPVRSFDEFAEQVTALVESAADYKSHLVVFPEYFTVQLLTLGAVHRPIMEQIRDLAEQAPRYVDLLSQLARTKNIYIAGGTIPVRVSEHGTLQNQAFLFSPSGAYGVQPKLHMTRFEKREWLVSPGTGLTIFNTAIGRIAITICYDVEFPEVARAAARNGIEMLLVPSCTDDRQGFLRVRYCAHARAIENQIYVVQSSTVGSLPMVPAVSLNYGQASILTPSDFSFARDGILAEGIPNQEMMVIGDIERGKLDDSRINGTVLPLEDSASTGQQIATITEVSL